MALLIGCESSTESRPSMAVRSDSAGIVVLLFDDPESVEIEVVSGTPVLTIESDDFYDIATVVPFSDGGLAVASRRNRVVHFFGANGVPQSIVGREGDGPGEFRGIYDAFGLKGDSLVVFDNRQRRLTFFSRTGDLGRTLDVSRYLPQGNGANVHPIAEGLALVSVASLSARRTSGIQRDSAGAWLVDMEGDSVGYYGRFPGTEMVYADQLFGALPFGAGLWTGARDRRLIVGDDQDPQVREYDVTGALVRVIRWPHQPRAVTDETAEEYTDLAIELATPPPPPDVVRSYRNLPFAAYEPSFRKLLVSDAGVLWIEAFPGPEVVMRRLSRRPQVWRLFDPETLRMRRIQTPPGFDLEAIRDGILFGVKTSELGLESIHLYEVPKP